MILYLDYTLPFFYYFCSMIVLDTHKKAYYAGLFDGEGSFQMQFRGGKRYYSMYCYACMTLADKGLIYELQEVYGGSVSIPKSKSEAHRTYYRWHLTTKKMRSFLDDVYTFLVIKKGAADIMIEFAETIGTPGKNITDEAFNRRLRLKERLHEVNRRGVVNG